MLRAHRIGITVHGFRISHTGIMVVQDEEDGDYGGVLGYLVN